jgi:tetrapyrrole methylase family protein/MazG family protein
MKAKELIKERYNFDDLCAIMALLRSEEGCPWDKEQTHQSIRTNLIEECYEAVEGIDKKDDALLSEELGDVLLQVVFHARIAQEEERFDMDSIIDGVCKKLVFRHPHIFGDTPAASHKEALDRWEEMKKKEKKTGSLSADLDRVARTLPSLLRSQKLLKKAQKAGYYEFPEECLDRDAIMEEYFHLCALADKAGVNVEQEAYAENERFIERMTVLEKLMEDQHADR